MHHYQISKNPIENLYWSYIVSIYIYLGSCVLSQKLIYTSLTHIFHYIFFFFSSIFIYTADKDKYSTPNAKEAFQIVADAYEVLKDPVSRREYDKKSPKKKSFLKAAIDAFFFINAAVAFVFATAVVIHFVQSF